MTPGEFDAIPWESCEPGYRYELVEGVLVVTPPPEVGERDADGELSFVLRSYGETHPQGAKLDATVFDQDVMVGRNRRRADRVIWAGLGRTPDPRKDVPTVAVEFVSKDRRDFVRDYEVKRDEYRAAGVAEYWIIDRFRRIMTVHRSDPDGAVTEVTVREGETYRTDRLPGFELPLARLLAVADRWDPPEPPQTRPKPRRKSATPPKPATHRPRPRQGRRDTTDG